MSGQSPWIGPEPPIADHHAPEVPAADLGSMKLPFDALPLVVCDICGAVTIEDDRRKHAVWHVAGPAYPPQPWIAEADM